MDLDAPKHVCSGICSLLQNPHVIGRQLVVMLPDHTWDSHINAVQSYYVEKHYKSHIVINHINPNVVNVLQDFSQSKEALK